MTTTIHYGKNSTEELCFNFLGSGRWVAESKCPPLTYENELLECHLYLVQCAFYVGFTVAERFGQVKGRRRCKHYLLYLFYSWVWNIKWRFNDSSAGIWQLLKYRAEVGTQTNGGLEEYREAGLNLRGVHFCPKKLKSVKNCIKIWRDRVFDYLLEEYDFFLQNLSCFITCFLCNSNFAALLRYNWWNKKKEKNLSDPCPRSPCLSCFALSSTLSFFLSLDSNQ